MPTASLPAAVFASEGTGRCTISALVALDLMESSTGGRPGFSDPDFTRSATLSRRLPRAVRPVRRLGGARVTGARAQVTDQTPDQHANPDPRPEPRTAAPLPDVSGNGSHSGVDSTQVSTTPSPSPCSRA